MHLVKLLDHNQSNWRPTIVPTVILLPMVCAFVIDKNVNGNWTDPGSHLL